MNLCFINPSKSRRPEIYGLAENLPKKYNITILQPSDKIKKCSNFYLRENIFVKQVPSFFMRFSDLTITIPIFKKWIKEAYDMVQLNKVDLIHVCDYEYLTSILPIYIKQKYGNISTVIVNDAILGLMNVGNYSFGSLLIDLISSAYTYTLGRKILKNYDKIILLYPKLAEQAEKLGLPREKIEIIPNGIDVEKIFDIQKHFDAEKIRGKYGIDEKEKVILYVGRLVKVKRVEIIIRVIKKLLEKNMKVKGLIVGDGPQRIKLENMARPINRYIKFTGYVSSKEKFECYHIADIFILPSISEGLPTVLLEAAAFGLPIIATNIHGIPYIVINGKTGFLVNGEDYNQYVEYAKHLILNQNLAKEMGENAKKHVMDNFSWKTIVKKYESIYEELFAK
ncbi:MAG: glycosyltransferase family 4 protein [archaeon YNP-LCB-024-027]|nr:glycosyltransferase family 4 protein [Candidatus Culexarchaeum yellowstonense]